MLLLYKQTVLLHMNNISFTTDQFGSLFPNFICLDEKGVVESCGNNITQLCGSIIDRHFLDVFNCIRSPEEIRALDKGSIPLDEMIIIHSVVNDLLYFKGRFERILHTGKLMFFGAPCYITKIDEINIQLKLLNNQNEYKLPQNEINTSIIYQDSIANIIQHFDKVEKEKIAFNDLIPPGGIREPVADDDYAITISDAHGKVLWCNPKFLEFTGYSFEEVKGKRPREVMYGKKSVFIDKAFVDKNVQKGKPFYFENIGYTKSGREYWFGVTVQPIFNKENEIIGRFHFLKDISNIKQKEQKNEENENLLKLSLEAAVAGSWSYDLITGEFQIYSEK